RPRKFDNFNSFTCQELLGSHLDTHHLFSETKIALADDVAEKLMFKNNETDVDGSLT
ncbi:hypothetical protein ISN44_As11g010380, partial [Arabidopsis suecica]